MASALACSLGGCATTPVSLPASAPAFSPSAFFSGRTEGVGALKILFSKPRPVLVHGVGHIAGDGSLVLDQRVDEEGKPTKTREWHIRAAGTERYAGTLSDAAGPIDGETRGNRLHLRFRMKGGLDAEQWLYLQPGGSVALNVMTVRKFGATVATLHETITKIR